MGALVGEMGVKKDRLSIGQKMTPQALNRKLTSKIVKDSHVGPMVEFTGRKNANVTYWVYLSTCRGKDSTIGVKSTHVCSPKTRDQLSLARTNLRREEKKRRPSTNVPKVFCPCSTLLQELFSPLFGLFFEPPLGPFSSN
ncbi:hypothetical protein KQX54_002387 [Cotesia glomerata]|uniref:Uncharacterized protein n=1 Tax=Cotesia glomerata TaxID=32391 RepID=A0AAV7ISE7_COTGL|nr:hypothetical protein KQX54_002387 [Cotesia glomerata]